MRRQRAATWVAAIASLAAFSVHPGWADPPAGSGDAATPASGGASSMPPPHLPQSGVMSSFAQSWRGADHDIVIGHFELGEGEKQHRYYCLADARTGKREPNGVLGDPVVQKDGTTAIRLSSVSMYTCADAERAGLVITQGYHLTPAVERAVAASAAASRAPAGASTATTAAATPSAPAGAPASTSASAPASTSASASAAPSAASGATGAGSVAGAAAAPESGAVAAAPLIPTAAGRGGQGSDAVTSIEVGGVHLGMSPEEVRAVLRTRWLPNYWEARDTLPEGSAPAPLERERFVSMISTWNAPATSGGAGESLEVLFTPVPGRERVYAIVHTEAYAPERALRQGTLESLLVQKYGGFDRSSPLPAAPTWRWSRQGGVEVGDACEQRGVFGGLREVVVAPTARANPALSMPIEELESQSARCGAAIVTEDHLSLNGSAPREERRVLRFTITAYSPALALEGARSARRGSSGAVRPARAERPAEPALSDL